MSRTILATTLALLLVVSAARSLADAVLYRYEADVVPYSLELPEPDRWVIFNPCDVGCSELIEDGHFILEFPPVGVNWAIYSKRIAEPPALPPATLWVEWRFRSNNPMRTSFTCDARLMIDYKSVADSAYMLGDAAVSFEGGDFILGLELNEFHTHRFESLDGMNYRFSVNGLVYNESVDSGGDDFHSLRYIAKGGCNVDIIKRSELDFVRYGTIDSDEQVLEYDPPGGSIPLGSLDRFVITFDRPGYVYVDEVQVAVSSGQPPTVLKTRRREGDGSEFLEIVLDRTLALNETTMFTFPTVGGTNTVSYTPELGACCLANGSCEDRNATDCQASGGAFDETQVCDEARACCFSDSTCEVRSPVCCILDAGTPQDEAAACEGDPDGDGLDSLCGDVCPNDPDNDIDDDGLCADADDCPELNPNDANNDGTPDCLEDPAIPTVSTWGLVVLTLACLIGGALMSRGFGRHPSRGL